MLRFLKWSGLGALGLIALAVILGPKTPEPTGCAADWRECATNSDAANTYGGMGALKSRCKRLAAEASRFGDPDWGGLLDIPFGQFRSGTSIREGLLVLVDDTALYPNAFGGQVRMRTICRVNLSADTIEIEIAELQ